MNKVIKQINMSFVRDGNQPPTFPSLRAAPAPHGHPFTPVQSAEWGVMSFLLIILLAAFSGCQAGVSVSGSFATPKEIITGALQTTTNAVTVGGTYQTGATNIGGTVTATK